MDRNQIKVLIRQMTLEEKAGQVTQLPSRYFAIQGSQLTGTETKLGISEEKKWLCGSILGKLDAVSMRNIQKENLERSRLQIPLMFMTDIVHGYQTIFPVPLAMAGSFDPGMVRECARISAKEGSAAGYQVTFSPMVDVVRDPRWGRVMESFGEDSKLNCDFGKAMVEGYQGENLKDPDRLAACVKHFAAYGAAEGGRDYNTSDVSEFRLRNKYFPPFKACIDAGVKLVMAAFEALNGIPATANPWLLQDILRKDLEFEGTVISDWGAVLELIKHGVAEEEAEAGRLALESGVQIEMATAAIVKHIEVYVKKFPHLEAILDEAVEKVLILKNELGLFEDPYRGVDPEREMRELRSPDKKRAAFHSATESAVLLENNGILPLTKETPVILTGPYAESKNILGPWSVDGIVEDAITVKDGLILKGGRIKEVIQTAYEEVTEQDSDRIVQTVASGDVVVLALGEPELWSGEAGSRSVIELPEHQISLLKKLHEHQIPVVVLLFNGRPLDLRKVKEYADAVLEMWFPGTEGGNAAAALLYGEKNPSGKLAMSFPYGSGQIPVSYDMAPTGRPKADLVQEPRYKSQYLDIPNEPLYSFGYGLSYTEYDVQVNGKIVRQEQEYLVPVKVTNLGNMTGKTVVQIYIGKKKSLVARPVKELVAYKKIELQPGKSKEIVIPIEEKTLERWIPGKGWTKEKGEYTILVSNDGRNFQRMELTVG